MTLYIILTAGLLVGGILLGALALLLFEVELEVVGFLLGVVAIMAVLGGLMVGILTPAEQAYGHSDCQGYARQTGREVRFVVTTSIDGGTCMTKDANGRWINKDDLRAVAAQQP